MDSPIVRELRDHHLTYADRGFALHLLGITAHVYADTFSHYGFSGVSSRGNKVDNSSFRFHEEVEEADDETAPLSLEMRRYVTEKADRFFRDRGDHGGLLTNVKSWFAEELSGALGHGSVATLPDRPYLVWSFEYERDDAVAGRRSTRNNPVTYLAGCGALHDMFSRFSELTVDGRAGGDGRDFDAIAHRVRDVLVVPDRLDAVIDAVNATGYGLTLGVHSRLGSTVKHIVARARVGNIYINRNMVGAVVGVQPFGGEGLSGTGPKAGGPRYLHRFATERTIAINTVAAGGNTALLSLSDDDTGNSVGYSPEAP